jgi:hypothetical protein
MQVSASASTAGEKRLAHDTDGQVGKDFPSVAHENGASVAMHKHPEVIVGAEYFFFPAFSGSTGLCLRRRRRPSLHERAVSLGA